jgi:ActR/RegA family two-component response regulator
MLKRVLLIDDDASLLNTLERNLCLDFDVYTAEGSQLGLEKLSSEGPFAVAVVDMRMPGMDGVEMIQQLRAKQDNLLFIMLTGNQDSATAIQAMNVGRVFRFLSKPCNVAEISQAIQEAIVEFDLRASEKAIMLNTMRGSINLLTELAAACSESIVSASEIADVYELILSEFSIPIRSEDRMACKLLLVGVASLPESIKSKLIGTPVNSEAFQGAFSKLCQASSQMVSHLPKFQTLTLMLEQTSTACNLADKSDPVQQRATALRIAFYWCVTSNRRGSLQVILDTLRTAIPTISRDHWNMVALANMANMANR